MTYYQLIIGMLLIGLLSCNTEKQIDLDYCDMLTKDQSFVDHDEKDKEVRKANRQKRSLFFVENYEKILNLTKQEGFPDLSEKITSQDSCRYWATTMTLIHIAQSEPKLMFNDETIALFQKEMSAGNMQAEDILPAFRVSFISNEFCEELRPKIEKAIEDWGLDSEEFREPKFKKCDNSDLYQNINH